MLTEVIIEDDRWQAVGLEDLAERAARMTLEHLGLDPEGWEISILACDDARMSELNGEFRNRSQPTNVLSWPSEERAAETLGARPSLPLPGPDPDLGDIAIAWETCLREATDADKSQADHVTHLIVHAVLHLLGYDHVRDEDATLMEATEVVILGKLGIGDPY